VLDELPDDHIGQTSIHTGQNRAHRQREHRHQPTLDPAAGTRIGHRR